VTEQSILWSLKYRPNSMDEISGRADLIKNLKDMAQSNDIPHLLFTGPKGYGKMEVARLFAKYVLRDGFDTNCKIVYASDPLSQNERDETRRMSYIPTRRVGTAAGRRFTWPAFIFSRIKPFVEIKPIAFHPLKILIIDDFHILDDQQHGFRRLMEKYSSYCRMILLTDQISSIIDPIMSRCNILFFKQIEFSAFESKIMQIAANENITLRGNIAKTLYIATESDIDKAITLLQTAALINPEITPNTIYTIAKDEFSDQINLLLQYAISLKTNRLKTPLSIIKKSGRFFSEVIEIMSEKVFNLPIVDAGKASVLELLSQIDFQSVEAVTDELLLDNLVQNLIEIGSKII
jgi:replication factor C small subunit